MTAIITGATGFIGRHLTEALAANGTDVRCLTRGAPAAHPDPRVSSHHVDYSKPNLGLDDHVLRGASVVYHLAGATRAISADAFYRANVEVTERIADRLIALGQRPRFVLVSSQAAAGPAPDGDHPKTEADAAAPIEDYGRSKLAAEKAVRARAADLPFTIVRPVAVYGPGDRDFLSIFAMIKRGVAIYPGIRNSAVNTIYVHDLVTGIIAAANAAEGQTWFLGDDTARTWKAIYAAVAEAMGQGSPMEMSVPKAVVSLAAAVGDAVGSITGKPLLVGRSKATLSKPKYWLCSSARARADFGFSTPTSLREGLSVTYDWYLQHRWL